MLKDNGRRGTEFTELLDRSNLITRKTDFATGNNVPYIEHNKPAINAMGLDINTLSDILNISTMDTFSLSSHNITTRSMLMTDLNKDKYESTFHFSEKDDEESEGLAQFSSTNGSIVCRFPESDSSVKIIVEHIGGLQYYARATSFDGHVLQEKTVDANPSIMFSGTAKNYQSRAMNAIVKVMNKRVAVHTKGLTTVRDAILEAISEFVANVEEQPHGLNELTKSLGAIDFHEDNIFFEGETLINSLVELTDDIIVKLLESAISNPQKINKRRTAQAAPMKKSSIF